MSLCTTLTDQISRQLNISCKCIRQTIRKFDKFRTACTKPGAGRKPKVTERKKRLIKLQQVRDDTLSLTDLARFARTDLNITISQHTISCILRDFNMISFIAPKKPRITSAQRRTRLDWCYEHLSWSINDWSNVVFTDETRFERSQQRVHNGGGIVSVVHKLIYLTYI
ncbi:unnamed protein product [Rotaria magnacalcarata]|uniref:Transposase Tc1-like domain-containing protein n=1 Tax=Rotaria magnacalcarata TaxID=392030 RepID=A0A815S0B6_9BILA|nr:unnamed protein product [Rotaria magnacalcarata]CAF1580870.1 unnamed protein product [Rotaria magnacalcarata]